MKKNIANKDVVLKEGSKKSQGRCCVEFIYKVMLYIETKNDWTSCHKNLICNVTITDTRTNMRTHMYMWVSLTDTCMSVHTNMRM